MLPHPPDDDMYKIPIPIGSPLHNFLMGVIGSMVERNLFHEERSTGMAENQTREWYAFISQETRLMPEFMGAEAQLRLGQIAVEQSALIRRARG